MVHSNHIEAFFKKNEFKCTNEDDFSTLACLLRAHLQKLEQLNSKRNQRRLLLQQLDMLEQSIERHQNCMSELSSQQRLQLGHVKCAALSRCFLRHLPDNHNRAFLEAASSFTSDGSTELVQVYWEQLKQVECSLQLVLDSIFCPLYKLVSQQTEDAVLATKRQLLEDLSGHADLRELTLDLNPEAALVLLSLQHLAQTSFVRSSSGP